MRPALVALAALLVAGVGAPQSLALSAGSAPTSSATPAADPAGPVARPLTGARLAEFGAYVEEALAATGVPGASVAVVQGGDVVYAEGFGVTELGGGDPVTPDTLMMVGSVTKPMTATMAAALVDDGLLAWDTPIADLLPGFAVADPELSRRLTVADAFCACTGLPQRDPEFLFNAAELTPDRLVASVADFPLTAPLGEAFQYSNQMFGVGGYAAAAAAFPGDPDLYGAYVRAMREELLGPLGMARSTFSLDDAVASGGVAEPHGKDLLGAYRPVSVGVDQQHVTSVAPAGALWSSATEMAAYARMELAGGLAPGGARVVSAGNLAETWSARVAIPGPPAASGAPPEFAAMAQGYGLGWVTGEWRGQRLLWHSGGTYGFTAQLALLPDAGLGVVVLANGVDAGFLAYAAQYRLFELAFGQPPAFEAVVQAGIAAGAGQAADLASRVGDVDPDAVAPYLGRYASEPLGEVTVALEGGRLLLDAGEFRAELRPLREQGGGPPTFLTSDLPLPGPATVAFGLDDGTPAMTFTDPTTGERYAFALANDPATPAATAVHPPSGVDA